VPIGVAVAALTPWATITLAAWVAGHVLFVIPTAFAASHPKENFQNCRAHFVGCREYQLLFKWSCIAGLLFKFLVVAGMCSAGVCIRFFDSL